MIHKRNMRDWKRNPRGSLTSSEYDVYGQSYLKSLLNMIWVVLNTFFTVVLDIVHIFIIVRIMNSTILTELLCSKSFLCPIIKSSSFADSWVYLFYFNFSLLS